MSRAGASNLGCAQAVSELAALTLAVRDGLKKKTFFVVEVADAYLLAKEKARKTATMIWRNRASARRGLAGSCSSNKIIAGSANQCMFTNCSTLSI